MIFVVYCSLGWRIERLASSASIRLDICRCIFDIIHHIATSLTSIMAINIHMTVIALKPLEEFASIVVNSSEIARE